MRAPENCGGFCFEGNTIEIHDGHIEVDGPGIETVAKEHGFVVVPAVEAKAKSKADK
jgi:hypothetical protein